MPENTTIYDSIFGQSPAVQAAAAARDASFQDWLNQRKQAVEQQRTEDRRIATFNALGNALTTMVQPLGWAIGGKGTGVTGGVQPVDNRQYLQAFERAMKANDDLRNIGTLEGEYQFKLADEAYRRAQAAAQIPIDNAAELDLYQKKADIDVKKQTAINDAKHETRMKEINQRYGWQKDIAEIRGKYRITQNGKSVSDSAQLDAEKKFNTAWKDYTTRIATLDVTPGIDMSNVRIMTKEEFYKWYMEGEGYHVQEKGGGSGSSSPTAPYVTSGSGDAGNGSGTVVAPYVK